MIKGERASEGRPLPRHSTRPRPAEMDPATKKIIGLLQLDGRRPYAEIADEVGIPEAEVVERVRRLTDAGVIQITAVTDPLQLGFARQAMLGLRVELDRVKEVAAQLAEIDEVVYVVLTAGGFEIISEVIGNSDAHLLEIVARIKPLTGVVSIHTFLYLELEKQVYTWGTR